MMIVDLTFGLVLLPKCKCVIPTLRDNEAMSKLFLNSRKIIFKLKRVAINMAESVALILDTAPYYPLDVDLVLEASRGRSSCPKRNDVNAEINKSLPYPQGLGKEERASCCRYPEIGFWVTESSPDNNLCLYCYTIRPLFSAR